MKLLLAEDDLDLAGLLTFTLGRAGFEVLVASDLPSAVRLLREQNPAVAILDVALGEWSGYDLLEVIRSRSNIPVLMLTGRAAEEDKIRALNLGADDYITKPFSHRELVARIHAQTRRHGRRLEDSGATDAASRRPHTTAQGVRASTRAEAAPTATRMADMLRVGPLTMDTRQQTLNKEGAPIRLSATQFRLLRLFMERAGSVIPADEILRQVWGENDPGGVGLVHVAIFRLRRKLEADPSRPCLLHTVPGAGFVLRVDQPCAKL